MAALHRRLIGVANIICSHPSGQDRDGNQFHHPNHQHRPEHTGQDSERSTDGRLRRHPRVAQSIGGDHGADRSDQPSAQVHVQQHLDHPLLMAAQQPTWQRTLSSDCHQHGKSLRRDRFASPPTPSRTCRRLGGYLSTQQRIQIHAWRAAQPACSAHGEWRHPGAACSTGRRGAG